MQLNKLLNANATVIAVTNTATSLKSLIDTAGGGASTFRPHLDAVDLYIEDGDVRVLYDGNTPTATKGILLKQGSFHSFRKINLDKISLIRAGSADVAVDVQVGLTDPEESTSHARQGDTAASVAGADTVTGRQVVEQRYSYGRVTADGLIKSGAGFIHTITFAPIAASPTAGVLTVYDNTSEAGTPVFSAYFDTTFDAPVTVHLDVEVATGIYVGYDGTLANVQTTVAYR